MARTCRVASILTVILLILFSILICIPDVQSIENGSTTTTNPKEQRAKPSTLPNVLVFIVDDLGWNQVGYHASKVGNNEIQTPNINAAVAEGIEMNRGYVTPWCGPSRAAIMTGRMNVYNANVSQKISTFDDDIGYVAGLPIGTQTIANAFKQYGASVGVNYTAHYIGKWGIGGTAWKNTPHGMGFDFFRGSWGTGIETCDGVIPSIGAIEGIRPLPFNPNIGSLLLHTLPGYWEQNPDAVDSDQCPYFRSVPNDVLSLQEKDVACKTYPRKPPKLLDLDILDKFTEQIATHDFKNAGPMLHVYSTFMMHLPMAYPAMYNEAAANNNYTNGMPRYFAGDQIKGPATINDLRWATNTGVRFVDDIFGRVVKAYKDAGQWNNTIIYFTTDNGGVVYGGTANNNYPLRASKFSPFEGGIRVPQFISGGWINQHLPEQRKNVSNTYIFANDITPTLLEMAGGDVSFLYGNKTGAPYGSQLWSYIKNSLDLSSPSILNHQKVRYVSYTPQMYFDIQQNSTLKFFYTGSNTMSVPRLYEPIWPKDGDLITDSSYFSVNPCRPGNIPFDCCIMDIEADWQENTPLHGDCRSMLQDAQSLYIIDGGCPKNINGKNINPICVESGEVSQFVSAKDVTLWTQYGAAGPFTNSKGQPLNDLPMKCACYGLQSDSAKKDFTYYIVRNQGPAQCGRPGLLFRLFSRFLILKPRKPPQAINCDGTLALDVPPKANLLDDFTSEGFDIDELRQTLFLEAAKITVVNIPTIVRMLRTYVNRSGRTDWPNVGKFPFLGVFLDTCKEKGVVPVPFNTLSIPPYMFGTRDVTIPGNDQPLSPGLCIPFSAFLYFCPAHQNAALKPVIEWNYDGLDPYGTFADGTRWEPMGLLECMIKCPQSAAGTAYIGDGPNGVVV